VTPSSGFRRWAGAPVSLYARSSLSARGPLCWSEAPPVRPDLPTGHGNMPESFPDGSGEADAFQRLPHRFGHNNLRPTCIEEM
jgi:hypothetical protein